MSVFGSENMAAQFTISRQSGSVRGPSSVRFSQISTGGAPVVRKAFSVYGAGGGGRTLASGPAYGSTISSSSIYNVGTSAGGYGSGSAFSGGAGFSGGGASLGSGAGFGGFAGALAGATDYGILATNEKATMQNLNDRLAAYLDKVRQLEAENNEYEKKIRACLLDESQGAEGTCRDYSEFEKTIEDMREKNINATVDNAAALLGIDNSKLAADDFRLKYENELSMRLATEADINGIRRILDDITLSKAELESNIESLKEELIYMKKNHEEDMSSVRSQITGQVNVEIDAAPNEDLTKKMEEMRAQYESIAEQNRASLEQLYKEKAADLNKEMAAETETLQTYKTEITDLRRSLQGLEIELQSQLARKFTLENSLAETDGRYGAMLQGIQVSINNIEEDLSLIRSETEQQSQNYKILLDIKTRLEKEISEYRALLEGEGGGHSSTTISSGPQTSVQIRTIVEEYKDGKKVSEKEEKRGHL